MTTKAPRPVVTRPGSPDVSRDVIHPSAFLIGRYASVASSGGWTPQRM
jgi:hypothetical protein